jgi:hypothetical protein
VRRSYFLTILISFVKAKKNGWHDDFKTQKRILMVRALEKFVPFEEDICQGGVFGGGEDG